MLKYSCDNMKNRVSITILFVFIVMISGLIFLGYDYNHSSIKTIALEENVYLNCDNNLILFRDSYAKEFTDAKYIDFRINGLNKKDHTYYYTIGLNYGDNYFGNRIEDPKLKFLLVENVDDVETILIDTTSYYNIDNSIIWVGSINPDTSDTKTYHYRLYVWCDETVDSGYASIKVNVNTTDEITMLGDSVSFNNKVDFIDYYSYNYKSQEYSFLLNKSNRSINNCQNYLYNKYHDISDNKDNYLAFCSGDGTINNILMRDYEFSDNDISYFINNDVLIIKKED